MKIHNVEDRINQMIGTCDAIGKIEGIERLILTDVGRSVVYQSHGANPEYGIIKSWNDLYIFVKFDQGSTNAACDPLDLTFVYGPPSNPSMRRSLFESVPPF